MTDVEPQEDLPPVAHVTIVYTGPIAPHWELRVRYGDQKLLDDFWARVNARLLLLPKHDPQFRRNRERVNRDAERELITCDWDLGEHDADTTITPVAEAIPAQAEQAQTAEPAPQAEPAPAGEQDAVTAVDDGSGSQADLSTEAAPVEQEVADQPAEI